MISILILFMHNIFLSEYQIIYIFRLYHRTIIFLVCFFFLQSDIHPKDQFISHRDGSLLPSHRPLSPLDNVGGHIIFILSVSL